jgi:hypothetical protein
MCSSSVQGPVSLSLSLSLSLTHSHFTAGSNIVCCQPTAPCVLPTGWVASSHQRSLGNLECLFEIWGNETLCFIWISPNPFLFLVAEARIVSQWKSRFSGMVSACLDFSVKSSMASIGCLKLSSGQWSDPHKECAPNGTLLHY